MGEGWRTLASDEQVLVKAGFYLPGARENDRLAFSVNIDARESWYESERSRFARWIEAQAPEAAVTATNLQRSYRSLAAWLLVPLALLVCGEIVFATLMRRGGRSLVKSGIVAI